ncbi:hypothetical protein niasHS_009527 [Heterodera schachtii]|uniref:BACK domain-containing protein n=1 Tax=Heterodera schachtii TaxID=97005 RepID=A0ABD2J6E2_HETSC
MEDFALRCLRYIDQNARKLLNSVAFLQIHQDLLCVILERDQLRSSEIEIWNAALRWADEQCRQNAIECSAENRREKLGSALFNIRLPLISKEEFTESIGIIGPKQRILQQRRGQGIDGSKQRIVQFSPASKPENSPLITFKTFVCRDNKSANREGNRKANKFAFGQKKGGIGTKKGNKERCQHKHSAVKEAPTRNASDNKRRPLFTKNFVPQLKSKELPIKISKNAGSSEVNKQRLVQVQLKVGRFEQEKMGMKNGKAMKRIWRRKNVGQLRKEPDGGMLEEGKPAHAELATTDQMPNELERQGTPFSWRVGMC